MNNVFKMAMSAISTIALSAALAGCSSGQSVERLSTDLFEEVHKMLCELPTTHIPKTIDGTESKVDQADQSPTEDVALAQAPASTPAQTQPEQPQQSAPQEASKPAHQHNFSIPITTTKTVVDKAGYVELVCGCGKKFSTVEGWDAHAEERALAGDMKHNYRDEYIPPQTHEETLTTGWKCACGAVM